MVEHVQAAELDRVFSALADPTRRAILQSLTLRPATINEIAKPFPFYLKQNRNTSWCWNGQDCCDVKSRVVSTTAGSSLALCAKPTHGWNTIGCSGNSVWM